jgi:sugar lactone lactonase YvrE
VETIASGFFPWSLALNSAGTILYATDTGNSQVKGINLSTFAITILPGTYSIPRGVTVDPRGHVFVADTGTHTIRKITGGTAITVAGYSGAYGTANGPGSTARFTYPFGIVAHTQASIYVADAYNHTLRRLLPDGPPPPTPPEFTSPASATFANGTFGSFTLTASGSPAPAFSVTAGSLPPGLALSGTSIAGTPAVSGTLPADFNFTVTAANSSGSVNQGFTLRVTAAAAPVAFAVSTVAGQVGSASYSDTPLPGRFNEPSGTATDGTYVYIADQSNHKIRRLHLATGALTSFGTGLLYPAGVAVDGAGNTYVTDTSHQQIKRFNSSGALTLTIGTGATGGTDSDLASSTFSTPLGIAVNSAGTLAYVADYFNACVRRIAISGSTGTVTTIPLGFQVWNVALDATGATLYVADYSNGRIKALAVPGGGTLTTLAGTFSMPRGLTVDALGNVYVVETGTRRVKRITGNNVVTVAGDGTQGSTDGAGLAARFYDPFGIIATSTTSLYVADMRNHTIRRMLPDPNAPAFTTAGLPMLAVGIAGSFTLTASGTPAPTFSLSSGALPPGMSFSGATISGTPTTAGTYTFSITATNVLGSVTQNFTLNVGTPSAPQIVTQPVGRTRDVGRTIQFRVEVTGNPAPTYVWSKNGAVLNDAGNYLGLTSNRFTIFDLKSSDAGSYTVTASNGVGPPVTSSAAALTVNSLPLVPTITQQPQSQTFPTTGVPVTLSVTARGVGTLSYQWFKDGLPLHGATARIYSIQSLLQKDYGSYRVEVRNMLSAVNSAIAKLDDGSPPVMASSALRPVFIAARKGEPFSFSLQALNLEIAPDDLLAGR